MHSKPYRNLDLMIAFNTCNFHLTDVFVLFQNTFILFIVAIQSPRRLRISSRLSKESVSRDPKIAGCMLTRDKSSLCKAVKRKADGNRF